MKELEEFRDFAALLRGDEKGEAQIFCDRFFRAFGHGGIVEANGSLEARIKFTGGTTKFADCLWAPRGRPGVLIEMKKRSERNLERHFAQLRDYWLEMNPEKLFGQGAQKPEYMMLCNFDRFLIYRYLSPVDEVRIEDIIDRSSAFNFMLPVAKEPIFKNNVEEISKDAASEVGELFKYLVFDRKQEAAIAQRFLLQCVVCLFSEDFGLLPRNFFSELIRDCQNGGNTYDLFGGLFSQMANPQQARGGRFAQIPYFNGGLFKDIEPIELDNYGLELLQKAATKNWKSVNPAIFGALFESTMNSLERHAFGAHFTSEADIHKIVGPTIVKPWRAKIQEATTLAKLKALLEELSQFKVLDPACGCGNFLFVAYMALKDIEMQIIEKIASTFSNRSTANLNLGLSRVSTKQFYGIDIQPVAVEVTKMTMTLAKELAADQWNQRINELLATLGLSTDQGLPLETLDDNITCKDAILSDWPKVDAIIGNPPFQSKNKMKNEMDNHYIDAIREKYPEIPARADFCVFWLRKAHDALDSGQRAGFVGTNTIRQNYSRLGGLDYIVKNKGTITDAVSTQVWSGDAVVHVSIVNWVKGPYKGEKMLMHQIGDKTDSPFEYHHPKVINSALSNSTDVGSVHSLNTNKQSMACYQGQTHGHKGFLIPIAEAKSILTAHPNYKEVLHPFLIGREMLQRKDSLPQRFVIDFRHQDVFAASQFSEIFKHIEKTVYPAKKAKADKETEKNKKLLAKNPKASTNNDHTGAFKTWWQLFRPRNELMTALTKIPRYCACARVTKRPIFEFVSSDIHPNDALQVFPLDDDYSFGILQSSIHWAWFKARCSTLKGDWRYTSDTVFDSFPWPQEPSLDIMISVAQCARELRQTRRAVMQAHDFSYRDLYRLMEKTPNNPVSQKQIALDNAVMAAYEMPKKADILSFLSGLNADLFGAEAKGEAIVGPGLPVTLKKNENFRSADCIMLA